MKRLCLTLAPVLLSVFCAGAPVDYARQVQPIFEEHCTDCHAAGDADGGFELDTFAALMKGGENGPALLAGRADDSLLVKFLEGRSGKTGKNQFMPPGKREHLSPDEIVLIKQWINEGAHGPVASVVAVDPLAKLPKIASQTAVKPIHAVAVDRGGKVAALGRYGTVELIDAATMKPLRKVEGLAGKPSAMNFSHDGAMLFVAAGEAGIRGVAYAIQVSDGAIVKKFEGHRDALHALALSPDGKTLVTGGYDQKIMLWDLATGKVLRTLAGHNGSINGLAFRPDGKVLASASADRTIKLWNASTGARLDTFSQPLKEQFCVAFTLDGKRLLAGGADNRIRVWSVSAEAKEGSNPILMSKFAHEGAVLSLAFSADGKVLLSAASDKTLKLWNAADVSERLLLEKQSDWSPAVAWQGSGIIMAARLDGTTARYVSETGKPVVTATAAMPKPKAAMAKNAPPATPVLERLEPRGFQTGATTMIKMSGKNLTGITAVKTSDPRVKITAQGDKLAVVADKAVPRGAIDVSVLTAQGESAKLKLHADDLPQGASTTLPRNAWGTLSAIGQQDLHSFHAEAGQTIVLDLAAKRVDSKALNLMLEVLGSDGKPLATSRGLDSGTDPFIAFKAPATGDYTARVHQITLDGSMDHVYRLTIGALPYVTGVWPLSVKANEESEVRLIGHHLPMTRVKVKAGANGEVIVPAGGVRSRAALSVRISDLPQATEGEPNDSIQTAMSINAPTEVHGQFFTVGISDSEDADHYAFMARKGERWMIETLADLAGSPADTRIDILNEKGDAVPRVQLQAVRDSAVTFRSVDADNPDIRLVNWEEMELNEFIYFQGDVARIFRMPRGPDAGALHYAIGNKRRAYFDTTATNHALDDPAYIVQPVAAGSKLVPNGLPVFTLNFGNDDAGDRSIGHDSRLTFTAPADGRYIVRVSDSRGWSGERFVYRLTVRNPVPDFSVALEGKDQTIGAGGSMGFSLRATRKDDFDGPITVKVEGVPQGCFVSSPVVIQEGHVLASGSIFAAADAPKMADWSKVTVTASAMIDGKPVTRSVNGLGAIKLGPAPKFVAFLEADKDGKPHPRTGMEPQVITVSPGKITKAWIRVQRQGDEGIINFDVHSLPHGVIINDIGLNGVQVRAKENEREIEFVCAKWVPEQDRLAHACVSSARTEADSGGLATSFPVQIKIVRAGDAVTQR
jgi:mono/diheme cytochrome c family protein